MGEIKEGSRIVFTQTLEEGPDEHSPGRMFCEKGETGEVVKVQPPGYKGQYPFTVKTDSWPNPFGAKGDEFEVTG